MQLTDLDTVALQTQASSVDILELARCASVFSQGTEGLARHQIPPPPPTLKAQGALIDPHLKTLDPELPEKTKGAGFWGFDVAFREKALGLRAQSAVGFYSGTTWCAGRNYRWQRNFCSKSCGFAY